jgi:hypothetical protein
MIRANLQYLLCTLKTELVCSSAVLVTINCVSDHMTTILTLIVVNSVLPTY